MSFKAEDIKVGYRLRICLNRSNIYRIYAAGEMYDLNGSIVTVSRVSDAYLIRIKEDKGKYGWSHDMFSELYQPYEDTEDWP